MDVTIDVSVNIQDVYDTLSWENQKKVHNTKS